MTAPSMGHQTRYGVGTSAPSTKQMELLSFGLGIQNVHVHNPGMRGTRSHFYDGVADGVKFVRGQIVSEPRVDDLAVLLPLILGAAAVGTTYSLAETVPTHVWDADKIADIYRYAGCKVNQATFQWSKGQPLRLTLDIIGVSETGGTSFPAISGTLSTYPPLMSYEMVLAINSVNYTCDNWQLVIDNALIPDRFMNSQTLTAIPESDRRIMMSADIPFTTDESAQYNLAVTGLAATATFTHAGTSLLFTFAKLQKPTIGPQVRGRNDEIVQRIDWTARKSGSTDELVVTLDSTP